MFTSTYYGSNIFIQGKNICTVPIYYRRRTISMYIEILHKYILQYIYTYIKSNKWKIKNWRRKVANGTGDCDWALLLPCQATYQAINPQDSYCWYVPDFKLGISLEEGALPPNRSTILVCHNRLRQKVRTIMWNLSTTVRYRTVPVSNIFRIIQLISTSVYVNVCVYL